MTISRELTIDTAFTAEEVRDKKTRLWKEGRARTFQGFVVWKNVSFSQVIAATRGNLAATISELLLGCVACRGVSGCVLTPAEGASLVSPSSACIIQGGLSLGSGSCLLLCFASE